MSLLFTYTLLMLLAMLWIMKDAETIYIFDVFGKNFCYVWFESGQRWTHIFTYGWRMVVLCLLVLLICLLSYRIYLEDLFEIGPAARLTVFVVLLAASFAPFPWIYLAHRLRWQRQFRATAQRLDDFVNAAIDESERARSLERAEYRTDEPWTAWHPKQDEWKSNRLWDGLVPVVYLRDAPYRSAIFPIDWETFFAWNIAADCVRVNSDLPVHGAFDSSFRVESVQAIRGIPNWWLVRTEMRSILDTVIEGCG